MLGTANEVGALRNQLRGSTFLVQIVPGQLFFGFDFACDGGTIEENVITLLIILGSVCTGDTRVQLTDPQLSDSDVVGF